MKISGFTIIKNAVINDYPIVEAITSILPVVDEMIVLIGDSKDATEALIKSIPSAKIKIHHSVWDPAINKGGKILAVETDKAFALIDEQSDWAFYIQADEAVHEKYHAEILKTAQQYKDDKRVDGLMFKYLHFYGSYDYVGDSRKWYNKEVRIIKNNKTISAFRDAQGFRRNGKKLMVKPVDAYVYHYGWVKNPKLMQQKIKNSINLWQENKAALPVLEAADVFDYNEFDSLQKFKGTHPKTMLPRIAKQNWKIELNIKQKKFVAKDHFLYWYEKLTGKRLFTFRNFKILKN
ncbi:MAG: glycosyltransferase family 2 protein [Parafilimonas sp.]